MVRLQATRCAICDTPDSHAAEVYAANFSLASFNPATFSARRLPDRLHYRMVRCRACGLLRSDPVADDDTLALLYAQSRLTYSGEVDNLVRTYGRYIARLERHGAGKNGFLEVGCGSGFVLAEARRQGYRQVKGIEPSTDAVAQAAPEIRQHIVCDVMRPGLFAPASFDVICFFQVFDHLADPLAVLREAHRLLRPNGFVLCLNHNEAALSARLLGARSPIVDIEHTFLYSPQSMQRLFARTGFDVVASDTVFNTYSAWYVVQLLPLPHSLKTRVPGPLRSALQRLTLRLPLGNMCVIARKSAN